MKTVFYLFLFCICINSCERNSPDSVEPHYLIASNHALKKDSFEHDLHYIFTVESDLSQQINEEGMWQFQLLREDNSYFTLLEQPDCATFEITPKLLVDLVPPNEIFKYEGINNIGRIYFSSNNKTIQIEKIVRILTRPAKPTIRITNEVNTVYPDAKHLTFECICPGAEKVIFHHEIINGTLNDYTVMSGNDYICITVKYVGYEDDNRFNVCSMNALGYSVSDEIVFGGSDQSQ